MFHVADVAFSDIHAFFTKVIDEVETKGHAELKALADDIQTAINDVKTRALKDVAAAAPDIQAAVQKALTLMEQAVLATVANRVP